MEISSKHQHLRSSTLPQRRLENIKIVKHGAFFQAFTPKEQHFTAEATGEHFRLGAFFQASTSKEQHFTAEATGEHFRHGAFFQASTPKEQHFTAEATGEHKK